MRVRLGDYAIQARLGRGAMGHVVRAVHLPSDTPVAVKLFRRTHPRMVELIHHEARAVAALDHPHVVALLDLGTIPEGIGGLKAGMPYLVMELCAAGRLDPGVVAAWSRIRRLLDEILDALAHAHARGVVHRDLKPGNILYAGEDGPRPGWRLTDFGLAHPVSDGTVAVQEGARGTPRYMAPEQFLGYPRDFGPWTDLYGLGCVAWHTLCGETPFKGDQDTLRRAHAEDGLPRLAPRMPVPRGLEEWLRILLAKAPSDRFPSAADAWTALRDLDRGGLVTVPPPSRAPELHPPQAAPTFELPPALDGPVPVPVPLGRALPPPPAHPPSWRDDTEASGHPALPAGTLSVVGIRRPPFVGRQAVRDRLWARLGEVHRTDRPGLVVLEGPPGIGATRLGEWFLHRASETGSALGVRANCGPLGEGGAADVVAALLHCRGLRRADTRGRLNHLVGQAVLEDADEAETLLEILHPTGPLASETVLAAVVRRLEHASRRRPVLLLLDDLHRGGDVLELVRGLVERPRLPLLVVGTSHPPALADDPDGAAALRTLTREVGGLRIPLGRLDAGATRELAEHLLDLDEDLARRVEIHVEGHPLFLVSLVARWVESGALHAGPRGWRLMPGATLDLPEDLSDAIRGHLDRAMADRPEADHRALELAAVLGEVVEVPVWERACAEARVHPAPDLLHHLLQSGLWRDDDGPVRFASEVVRRFLVDRGTAAGHAAGDHRACVRALGALGPVRPATLGRHLLRAGAPEEALPHLLEAAEGALEAEDPDEAGRILVWLDEALSEEPAHTARVRGLLVHAAVDLHRGALSEAATDLARASELEPDEPVLRVRHALLRARLLHLHGRTGEALATLDVAVPAAWNLPRWRARLHRARAALLLHRGELAEADRALEAARPGARRHPADLAAVHELLSTLAQRRGQPDDARRHLEQARHWFALARHPVGPVRLADREAALLEADGHPEAAIGRLRRALGGWTRLGRPEAFVSLTHLARLEAGLRRHPEARAAADHAIAALPDDHPVRPTAWLVRLCCDAWLGDSGSFDEALEALEPHLERLRRTPETRRLLRSAATGAHRWLDARRARRLGVVPEAP